MLPNSEYCHIIMPLHSTVGNIDHSQHHHRPVSTIANDLKRAPVTDSELPDHGDVRKVS